MTEAERQRGCKGGVVERSVERVRRDRWLWLGWIRTATNGAANRKEGGNLAIFPALGASAS